MKTGTVKFFNEEKGFGFIQDEESNRDVFVHKTGLVDKIRENDRVTYEMEDTPKGPCAINVKRD